MTGVTHARRFRSPHGGIHLPNRQHHPSSRVVAHLATHIKQEIGASRAATGRLAFPSQRAGLTPTPIANYLIEQSAAIKAQVSSVERQVRRLVDRDAGELRIGVGPIIEQVLLPQTLIELRSKTGKVRFSVLTEHADVLMARLEAGDLDVVAGPFAADWQDIKERGLIAVDLIQEPTINVARPDHPILQVKDPDFLGYPYASPPLQGAVESELTNPGLAQDSSPKIMRCSNAWHLLQTISLADQGQCLSQRSKRGCWRKFQASCCELAKCLPLQGGGR